MNTHQLSILCVDDNQDNCELLTLLFEQEGFKATSCGTTEECLFLVKEQSFDALVLDNRIGDSTTIESCKEIRFSNPSIPIVFYSGDSRPQEIVKALSAGASAYLVKPNDFDKLTATVISLIAEAKQTTNAVN